MSEPSERAPERGIHAGGLELDAFEALTFDCYGTIIDWESGITDALRVLLEGGTVRPAHELLESFGRLEAAAEEGPFEPYRAVLTRVARGLRTEAGLAPDPEREAAFAASVPDWPPFPDSSDALVALGARYRLAIVSNVDDDLFGGSAERLGITFDEVVTAQQVRSYKPARAHFDAVLARFGLPVERVLHVAQSLYHDVAPAKALGFSCVWVNRRAGKAGAGATPAAVATPDLEVADLAGLVRAAGLEG